MKVAGKDSKVGEMPELVVVEIVATEMVAVAVVAVAMAKIAFVEKMVDVVVVANTIVVVVVVVDDALEKTAVVGDGLLHHSTRTLFDLHAAAELSVSL